jgi:hypothetical protein
MPPLTNQQIAGITYHVDHELPLSPQMGSHFIKTDLHGSKPIDKIGGPATLTTVGLLLASVGIEVAQTVHPELKSGIDVTQIPHLVMNVISDRLPGELSADSTDLLEHTPFILEGLALTGAARATNNIFKRRSLTTQAQNAQQAYYEKVRNGEASWDMSGMDSVVAYVGNGLTVPDTIASEAGNTMVQVSYKPIRGINVVLPADANYDEALEAHDRADTVNARCMMVFTSADGREIYPDPNAGSENYDIGVARGIAFVERGDEACRAAGVELMPAVFVGDPKQPVIEVKAKDNRNRKAVQLRSTLEEAAKEFEQERGQRVVIVDPTKEVTDVMIERSPDRPLRLETSMPGWERYAPRFAEAVQEHNRKFGRRAPGKYVVVNISDRSTERAAQPDDFVIIKDARRHRTIEQRGVDKEDVVVVGEAVWTRKIKPLLEEFGS